MQDIYNDGDTLVIETTDNVIAHRPWPSIDAFYQVIKTRSKVDVMRTYDRVSYNAKIKLHGTNAAVRITDGKILAQKRTDFCTVDDDNFGFAQWVEDHRSYFEKFPSNGDITIFGEWAGPGICKGTAISKIPYKIFAVFAMLVNNMPIYDPQHIRELMVYVPSDIFILPWHLETPIDVQFSDGKSLADFADKVNELVSEVEKCDPWVKGNFQVEGIGEGLVFYPIIKYHASRFMFKAKGEEHRVHKTRTAAQVDPEKLRSKQEFADKFVTEARFEQILREGMKGEIDVERTGEFIKLVMSDIYKECLIDLEASGYTWKDLSSLCATKARLWYLDKVKQI